MIANIKITALTPVHIGSGNKLPLNIEVLYDGERLGIISPEKVLAKIGTERLSQWTAVIDRKENVWEFLKKSGVKKLEEVSDRIFNVYGSGISNKKDLKEQLTSLTNFPIIPGSSIKGAIRTAVLSWLINENPTVAKSVLSEYRRKTPSFKWVLRDFQSINGQIVNKYFNGTPKPNANRDVFRFLQVTDAVFEYETLATNVKILNLERNGWDFKKAGDQITEAIGAESETEIRIKINKELLQKNKDYRTIQQVNVSYLDSFERIFSILNNHTLSLLHREIELWEEEINQTGLNRNVTEPVNEYLAGLKKLKDITSSLSEKQGCVLRIGGNEGWDFITGAWIKINTELLSDAEWDKLYKQLNKGRNVDVFPKTRKLDEDGDFFGFVKLEIA